MGIEKFIRKVCVQVAVYWPSPEPDGYGGMSYDDPEEVAVRWDDTTEVVTSSEGKEIVSRAKILTPHDLEEQGRLYLGRLTDLTDDQRNDPQLVEKAYEIKRFDRVPMVMSDEVFIRTAYL